MENKEIDLIELSKLVWSQRKRVIKWSIIGAVTGLIIAFSIPKEYQTKVKIAPEAKTKVSSASIGMLAEIAGADIAGNSGTDGISEKVYPEIIGSTPFLLELANIPVQFDGEQISFYQYITKEQKSPWWSHLMSLPSTAISGVMSLFSDKDSSDEDTISIFNPTPKQLGYIGFLKKNITVESDKKLGIISITTTMQDPLITAIIADTVLNKLQDYISDYRTAKNRSDLDINTKRLKDAKANYYAADSIYASVMDKNQGLVSQSARVRIDRLLNEKELTLAIYQQLASQVEMSKVKLQESTPIATIIEPASVPTTANSPKKLMIIIALACLAGLGVTVSIITKQIFKKVE